MYVIFKIHLKNPNKRTRKCKYVFTACNTGSYGIDCKERCGHCLDVYKCSYTNGVCLTGCVAGYQGNLCKTRELIFHSIRYMNMYQCLIDQWIGGLLICNVNSNKFVLSHFVG